MPAAVGKAAQIFHRDRDAVQRPAIAARGDLCLRRLGLGHRDLRHHQRIAAERSVQGGDTIELGLRHRHRRDLARLDACCQFCEFEEMQVGGRGIHWQSPASSSRQNI
jgi:hypothetical protein